MLQGSAAIGASTLAFRHSGSAFAQPASVAVRIERDIQNMDPANRTGSTEGNILRCVLPRLVRFKPGVFEWETDAAETIAQVDDTTIEFVLRPGIQWQQGFGELTADDVKFSFERFNPSEGERAEYAADWSALDHVEVTGALSGRIILKHPSAALWATALSDVSGCIVCRRAYEELGDAVKTTAVIGTGPYMLAERIPNQSITLRADPNYFGAAPAVPEFVLYPIEEPRDAQRAIRSGEIDFTKLDDPAAVVPLSALPDVRIIKQDSTNYVWIGMNVEKPPLDDIRVRHAIRLGIDVEEVIVASYNGTVSRANSPIAPQLLGHWADAPMYQRDPDAARQLLAEAGHEDGFGIRLTLLDQSQHVTAGQVVQAQLAEIGIDVELQILDGGRFWSMGNGTEGENLELALQAFGGKADPSFQTQWFVSDQVGEWNWQRWRSEEYDHLNGEAERTLDSKQRAAIYIQMQQLMDESSAFIWLTHGVNVFATRSWLEPAILPNGDDWQYPDFTIVS